MFPDFGIEIVTVFHFQVFVGNPLEEDAASATKYIEEVTKRLLFLKKLDGFPVIRDLVLSFFTRELNTKLQTKL